MLPFLFIINFMICVSSDANVVHPVLFSCQFPNRVALNGLHSTLINLTKSFSPTNHIKLEWILDLSSLSTWRKISKWFGSPPILTQVLILLWSLIKEAYINLMLSTRTPSTSLSLDSMLYVSSDTNACWLFIIISSFV